MNVLVIGSGGREHALVWKIRQSPRLGKLYCSPGNPGIEGIAECIPIPATDLDGLLRFAQKREVDLTIVGPEQPLAMGIVDLFEQHGLAIFGPTRDAARLEWSKAFAKDFMLRHGIPTAGFRTFTAAEREPLSNYLRSVSYPIVIKQDGLAAGKGVAICEDLEVAFGALGHMRRDTVVVEEHMTGEEASIFAVCDGTRYVILAPAQDHKRVYDGDRGKNTGGMGAYAPARVITPEMMEFTRRSIVEPTLKGMAADNHPYKGCLYVGVMITPQGPKVVEYNSRFGDPETQVVLPLYRGDILEMMEAACSGRLDALPAVPSDPAGSAVCVVLASGGYPDTYETGKPIRGLDHLSDLGDVIAFHAGTKRDGTSIVTSGGRVLGLTALLGTEDIERAIDLAYEGVRRINFEGMHFRTDIGARALARYRSSFVQERRG